MVAPEGQVPVAVAMLVSVAMGVAMGPLAAIPAGLVGVVLGLVYRERRLATPALPLGLVSPVTARVRSAELRNNPWLENRPSLRFVLRVRFPGITGLRSPIEAKIMDFWVRGGASRDGSGDGSPTVYATWLQTDEGDDLVVAVHGLRHISRFKAQASPGERVGHGHRLGFVYFATVVVVYAPPTAELHAESGLVVNAGANLLGLLSRDAP